MIRLGTEYAHRSIVARLPLCGRYSTQPGTDTLKSQSVYGNTAKPEKLPDFTPFGREVHQIPDQQSSVFERHYGAMMSEEKRSDIWHLWKNCEQRFYERIHDLTQELTQNSDREVQLMLVQELAWVHAEQMRPDLYNDLEEEQEGDFEIPPNRKCLETKFLKRLAVEPLSGDTTALAALRPEIAAVCEGALRSVVDRVIYDVERYNNRAFSANQREWFWTMVLEGRQQMFEDAVLCGMAPYHSASSDAMKDAVLWHFTQRTQWWLAQDTWLRAASMLWV